jgi:outer membrane lipoprotein-sorting protein
MKAPGNYMVRLKFIFLSFIFLIILPAFVYGDADSAKTDEVLLRIKQASKKIKTLQGNFVQKKKIKILKEMPDSYGRISFQEPMHLRWEILSPVIMGFVIDGDNGRKWQGDKKRIKKFEVSKDPIISVISNQVFNWANGDYERLKTGYDLKIVNDHPVEIKLIPLSPVEKKYINSIILAFTENEEHVNRIEILEKKGGLTQIFFSDIVINKELQEDEY